MVEQRGGGGDFRPTVGTKSIQFPQRWCQANLEGSTLWDATLTGRQNPLTINTRCPLFIIVVHHFWREHPPQ